MEEKAAKASREVFTRSSQCPSWSFSGAVFLYVDVPTPQVLDEILEVIKVEFLEQSSVKSVVQFVDGSCSTAADEFVLFFFLQSEREVPDRSHITPHHIAPYHHLRNPMWTTRGTVSSSVIVHEDQLWWHGQWFLSVRGVISESCRKHFHGITGLWLLFHFLTFGSSNS